MSALKARASDRPAPDSARKKSGRRNGAADRAMLRQARRRRLVGWAAAFVLAMLGGTVLYGVQAGWHHDAVRAMNRGLDQAYAGAGLTVQEVTVSGRDRAGHATLRQALDVDIGTPILRLDLDALRDRIEAIGWVESATVNRQLPSRLHVAITERVPFARWQHDGKTALIDRSGAVILNNVRSYYPHLPRLVGIGANTRGADLIAMLDSVPGLAREVTSATLIRERRWDIALDRGITVSLPETDPAAAWERLADPRQRERLLADNIATIDMRIPGRVIVRTRAVPAQGTRSARGQERET